MEEKNKNIKPEKQGKQGQMEKYLKKLQSKKTDRGGKKKKEKKKKNQFDDTKNEIIPTIFYYMFCINKNSWNQG